MEWLQKILSNAVYGADGKLDVEARASITSETEITASEIIGRIGSNLEYAPYVHNGTGIYAVNGDGRKTPWVYEVKAGKYKGMHFTVGQRPKPFLSYAIIYNAAQIEKILGG